uniref:BTB domain-containing protein n=1 Tax=Branchiostoma floridae TaxID=7739 RepID=C3ZFU3_BRAFL|eukprot:XP_002592570.1 hypothetical protein BRAFLDRAFT_118908 [Branchiostoma floridae]
MAAAEYESHARAVRPCSYEDESYRQGFFDTIGDLQKAGVLQDVVLEVEGRRFPCHRLVLSAASPYFRAMFTSGMAESRQKTVVLQGLDAGVFGEILSYIYSGTLHVSLDKVQPLYQAADLLQLDYVRDTCSNYMVFNVDNSTCVDLYRFAEFFSIEVVKNCSLLCICVIFSEVSHTEEFYSLSVNQLTEIISKNNLNVKVETTVWEAVVRWVQHNREDRLRHLPSILPHIRFNLLTSDDTAAILEHPLVSENSGSSELRNLVERSGSSNQKRRAGMNTEEVVVLFRPEDGFRLSSDTEMLCVSPRSGDYRKYIYRMDTKPTVIAATVTSDNDIYILAHDEKGTLQAGAGPCGPELERVGRSWDVRAGAGPCGPELGRAGRSWNQCGQELDRAGKSWTVRARAGPCRPELELNGGQQDGSVFPLYLNGFRDDPFRQWSPTIHQGLHHGSRSTTEAVLSGDTSDGGVTDPGHHVLYTFPRRGSLIPRIPTKLDFEWNLAYTRPNPANHSYIRAFKVGIMESKSAVRGEATVTCASLVRVSGLAPAPALLVSLAVPAEQIPTKLDFEWNLAYTRPNPANHSYIRAFKVGIMESKVSWSQKRNTYQVVTGGTINCDMALSNRNPPLSTAIQCTNDQETSLNIIHGDEIEIEISAKLGGYLTYHDFDTGQNHNRTFTDGPYQRTGSGAKWMYDSTTPTHSGTFGQMLDVGDPFTKQVGTFDVSSLLP